MNDLLTPVALAEERPLKIIALSAENVKRIEAVEIRPDGNLVEITGRNAQGKTSVLDAIWWAMKGRGVVQTTPIRRGCEKAHIRLDLGEYTVTRTFNAAKEGGFTTSVKVEAVNGFRAASPQALLDGLMGELSVDPLAFMRMDGRAQSDVLRSFVANFDFDAHEAAQKTDYAKRTEVNRDAKQARAAAAQIQVPDGLPDAPIDEAALTDELAKAGEHNASIETRRHRRESDAQKAITHREGAAFQEKALPAVIKQIEDNCATAVAEIEEQIAALQKRIADTRAKAAADIDKQRTGIAEDVAGAIREAEAIEAKLAAAPPLPEPIDIAAIRESITVARTVNDGIRQRSLRDRQVQNAEACEAEAAALTKAMADRDDAKQKAIAAAALPIPGIEFSDGGLLLNGVPLDQASDAEQLRVSISIAMAVHPRLRVIRVRDGNVLDADGMKLLAGLAAENDCQVWVETVRHDDRMAFVIEDGRVKPGQDIGEAA